MSFPGVAPDARGCFFSIDLSLPTWLLPAPETFAISEG